MGQRELCSTFLPPFKNAVKAGVKSIMTSYNEIDGIPCTSNNYLLIAVLRNQWNFNGFVVSDLGSIEGIATSHFVATNIKDAAALALKAQVDMDLGGNAYGKNLKQALEEKIISIENINLAVSNILRLKFEMGLFENPYVKPEIAKQIVQCEEHKNLAKEVARQGITLLKNDGILPLSKNIKNIAVIGPNADEIYNQLGDYTAPQTRSDIITVLDGVKNIVSSHTRANSRLLFTKFTTKLY